MNRSFVSIYSSHVWDPSTKEPWFIEFEKEPVNDEKWSCIVTTAVPNEAADEEHIEMYTECVATGTRKAVTIISMADVVKLLKESNTSRSKTKQDNRKSKMERYTRKVHARRFPYNHFPQVLSLAAKYAILNDHECKLQPELMAAVLKCMILNVKEEHRHQKRVDAVRERKIRERNIKAKFIKEMKPFEVSQKINNGQNSTEVQEQQKTPIKDEPVDGPDLYILLVNFYDSMCYPELQRINIPFCAIFKIKHSAQNGSGKPSETEVDADGKKQTLITNFWESLKENCEVLEKTDKFKDVAIIEYKTPLNFEEPHNYYKDLYNEFTWMQYSAYQIKRQHQKYLQELHVQRLILSLEPLDLSRCAVYNKLCDALITGEPLTPLLVLYAMIEQVVAGVPETESEALEYQHNLLKTKEVLEPNIQKTLVTPCMECRDKKYKNICGEAKQLSRENQSSLSEDDEWTEATEASEENSENSTCPQTLREEYSIKSGEETLSQRLKISKSLLSRVAKERKKSRESQNNKKWRTPKLCFYGDSISIQTYHCDPRIIDTTEIYERFLKNSKMSKIWKKYPELAPGDRAFFNFHFLTFQKISKQTEERIKLKVLFFLSMKLVEITKSYIFKGDSDAISEMIGKPGKLSKVKFNESTDFDGTEHHFSIYFIKKFILVFIKKRINNNLEEKHPKQLTKTTSDGVTRMVLNSSDQRLTRQGASCSINIIRSIGGQTSQNLKTSNKDLMIFYALLDCFDISSLTETHFLNGKDNFLEFMRNFKFYEKLSPNLMMQRLFEVAENYNAIQCTYFPPTDTLIVSMSNDCDHRGIFYNHSSAALLTPVTLRDFYEFVYPTIGDWLLEDYKEYIKLTTELVDKLKEKEEKRDAEYLKKLKQEYCSLSEEQREKYLEALVDESEPEVKEKELSELPVKPQLQYTQKVSFVATNYNDLRVETTKDVHEFYSEDGTKVSVTINSWLYSPSKILNIVVKRSALSLCYYRQITAAEEDGTFFTFKTDSGMILSFHKDTSATEYNLTNISWPVGLLIQPMLSTSYLYIKQSYLNPYTEGWEIEEENSRFFLKNGSVLIFKKNGDYDILCGSGTKYTFYKTVPKYELISTTGEVWAVPIKGPCRNRKKLLTRNKIFIGVDPKTQEAFYKREDGMCCMLWQSGKLVTKYPDGTKITSFPSFAEEEVITDWTEEEKSYFEELDTKYKSEVSVQERRSRTTLKNSSSTPKITDRKSQEVFTGFVLVTCDYLMEHPKYATVCFDSQVKITMPERLCVVVNPNGSYKIQQDMNFLTVNGNRVEFYLSCPECCDKSKATIYFNPNEVLCKVIDFFQNALFVYRDGKTKLLESYQQNCGEGEFEDTPKAAVVSSCPEKHSQNQALKQRCFAFERDLSGFEFIHSDTLAHYFHQLPESTYFEFDADDPENISHTFVSSYHKVGFEKWEMCYEENEDSLPKNIKKKHMKELGKRQVQKNLFKYPFPEHHNYGKRQQNEDQYHRDVEMPKIILSRTVQGLSKEPDSVFEELQKYVKEYKKKAQDIFMKYKNHTVENDWSQDSRYVNMRLRKIALTQSQSLQMYPHLCENWPSTEKDIHYFGHFINLMEEVKGQVREHSDFLSECKQTPNRLPRSSDFPPIDEEYEFTPTCLGIKQGSIASTEK